MSGTPSPYTYTVILELESIGLVGLDLQTHGFADREYCPPGGEQYLPLVDTQSLPSVTTAIFEEGRTGGASTTPTSKFKLVRHVLGKDRLAFLAGREIAGRPARAIAVGTLPDGQTYTYAASYVIADGEVGPEPVLDADGLEFEIRRRGTALETEVPTATYNGLGEALLFDGVDDSVTTPMLFQPGDGTALGWVFIPREYAGKATPQTIASNDALTITLSPYADRRLDVVHQTSPGTYATVAGPAIPEIERLYFWAIRWTAAGELTVWLDDARVEASGVTIHDPGTAWEFGATPAGQNRLHAIAAGWAFFLGALDDDRIEGHRLAAPLGSEEDLYAFYAGESDSGTLFEHARVNNPPIDATVNGGALPVNVLEGGAPLRGNLKRRVLGWAENVLGVPVDPTRLIYQWGSEPIQSIIAIYDRQAPFEIVAVHDSLFTFFTTPPTNDGEATVYPRLGLARFYALPDSAVVTADVFGESPWTLSRVLEPDGWLSWGTALNPYFSNSFTWEFAFVVPQQITGQTLFRAGTWRIRYEETFLEWINLGWRLNFHLDVDVGGEIETLQFFGVPVDAGASHFCSVVVDEDGSGVTVSLYLDGNLAEQTTLAGATLLAATDEFRAGRGDFFPWQYAQGVHISEMRLWGVARTEAEIRSTLFETGALPGVAGLWRGRLDSLSNLPDDVGTADATLQGTAGHWAPGVYAGSAVAITHRLLTDIAGIEATDVDLDHASDIDTSPQSLVLDQEIAIREALAQILDGLNAAASITQAGVIVVRQLVDPETAVLDGEIFAHQIESIEILGTERPATVWKVGYRPVWHQQDGDAVATGASADRVALVSKPRRYAEACEPANRDRYPSAQHTQSTDSNLRFAAAAQREADRQKAMRKDRHGLVKVNLLEGPSSHQVGGVYKIHHPDLEGGVLRAVVLTKTENLKSASLKVWGRA